MLTGTAATMLRSGVTRSCALPPFSLLRTGPAASSTSANPYSTFPAAAAGTPIFTVRSKQLPTTTTTTTTARPSSSSPAAVILRAAVPTTTRRHASTSRDHDADAQAAARAAAAAARSDDLPPLDWNAFFKLRKTRRRWQVAFSITMSLASGAGGAVVLSTGVADGLTNQIPLDPVLTLGLFTFGFVALGWLAGPSLGSAVFYLINRKYKVPMTVKESQFFARIKKNRVDPTNSSTGNPVPDFYGEKISSVAGYRQWLKDQRAFNKKRTTFI